MPGGGVRCTITAAEDASLSQANPDQADGNSVSMGLSGYAGSETRSLVKIPIVAGSTPCAEGGTVPSGMQVRSATLRLFTWKVNGAVDCATDCWHVLKRATSSWSEDTATWNTPLSTMAVGNELFEHGTGTGDYGARFQLVSGPGISTDVASFYAAPNSNMGWVIDQACAPDYPGRNCSLPEASFLMRTSEWHDAGQRPQLSIVFGRSITDSKQIRNIAFGTCASIYDNNLGDGSRVVAQPCAGKGWQAWNYDPNQRFIGLNNNKCMETAQQSANGSEVLNYDCGEKAWQKWTVDGSAIKYNAGTNKCLEIKDGNPAIGTALSIDECDGSPEQQWAIEPLIAVPAPGAPVRLRNVAGNNCADVAIHQSAEVVEQTWMQLFPCMGSGRTTQSFIPMADGRLVLVTNNSYCLNWPTNGGPNRVTIDHCHQGANQQWIRELGGRLRNLNDGTCLTGGPDINWLKLTACDDSLPVSQQWIIEPATSPSLAEVGQFQNAASGACIDSMAAPSSGTDMVEVPCDSSRQYQKFIRLNSGEIRSLAKLELCFHVADGNANKDLEVGNCSVMPEGNVSTNTHQQFDLNADSQLVNRKNGVCVQGYGPGSKVRSQNCDASLLSQKWNFGVALGGSTARQIRNVGYKSCLDGVNQSGDGAGMWPCSGESRPQQAIVVFTLSEADGAKTVEIRKVDNINKCLDQQDNAGLDARSKWQDCSGSNYQKWAITPTATPGEVRIAAFNQQGRCITGAEDESLAKLKACADGDVNQHWTIEEPEDERKVVQIRNLRTDGCLDVRGTVSNGSELTDFPCLGSSRPAQAFLKLNNKSFVSMANTGLCLDRNDTGAVGKVMLLWNCNRALSQKFIGSNDPAVAGQFKNENTGRCAELRPGSNNVQAQDCAASGDAKDYQSWFVEPVTNSGTPPIQFRYQNGDCMDITVGFDGDKAQVLPCMGSKRLNQQFVVGGTGLIRLRTDPAKCLSSGGSGTGKEVLAATCDGSKDDQKWAIDGGRLRNKRGATLEKCIRAGSEGGRFTMQDCSTDSNQQVVQEDAGLSQKSEAIGHLRLTSRNTCAESHDDNGGYLHLWGLACAGSDQVDQIVVTLTNGQIRSFSDLTKCLDANHGAQNEYLYFSGCTAPANRLEQQFDIDSSGFRTRAVYGGIRRCVTAEADVEGTKLTQTVCSPSIPGQQWTFEPVAMP